MITEFLIVTAVTTTTALIWRALLLDHPILLERVRAIPLLGGALQCGFCAAVWLSLIAVTVYNPIAFQTTSLHPLVALFVAWFTLAAAVLFLRNLITVLIEATGVLTHKHRFEHKD